MPSSLLAMRDPDVPVRTAQFRGRLADGLLEHAEDAQLVVVGVHGRHRFPGGAVGSTSYTVLHHHVTCPVAVVGEQGWPL
jgi:nucleotide-binding universal stress UspA family protein